ncbi:MAG: complex I subunit 5 family protein [Solirubrobacterales bacterium]
MIFAALLIPWVSGVALLLADGRRAVASGAAVAAAATTVVVLGALAAQVIGGAPVQEVAGDWPEAIGITLRADALGVLFAVVTAVVVLAAVAHEALAGVQARVFPALALLLLTGLTGLFMTHDVFNFYVFFELSMVSAYALAATDRSDRQVSGAFVFAVVNLIGSFVFLIAVAAMYHVSGTLEMDGVARGIAEGSTSAAILIATLVLVAFSIKLGLFPFHFWLPAVYIGASPAVAALLAGALANIGSYGLLRFGAELLPDQLELGSVALIALGSASVLYGALQAVGRRATSEVLAYSNIGQVGYVLIALGVGGSVGLAAAVLYAIVNALNKALLFLSSELSGWVTGAAFAVGALSVVGVPPAAGFVGKLALFNAGVQENSVTLVALIFLGGALSFLYMFQLYQHDFWADRREARVDRRRVQLVSGTLAVGVLALGAWPEPLLSLSADAARALGGG